MHVMTQDWEPLTARLERHAERMGDDRAFTFLECGEMDGPHLTWRQLDERRRRIAGAIRQLVPRRSRALLLFNPGLDIVPAFFGSLSADVIPVPAYPPSGLQRDRVVERLRGIVADAASRWCCRRLLCVPGWKCCCKRSQACVPAAGLRSMKSQRTSTGRAGRRHRKRSPFSSTRPDPPTRLAG